MTVANNASRLTIPRQAGRHTRSDLVRARELSASTILVAAHGEIDAATAPDLGEHIERNLAGYRQLVLDLSGLEFFGTAGYAVLHRVHSRCARSGIDWALVPGRRVQRLLQVCDPAGLLPAAPNIVAAVAALARNHTSLLG